jgi:hypothetical protein
LMTIGCCACAAPKASAIAAIPSKSWRFMESPSMSICR